MLQNERDVGKKAGFFSRFKNSLVGDSEAVLGVQRPHDVYAEGNRYFISDGARSKVVMFDLDTKSATVIGEGGDGFLKKPMGIGGDGSGTLYVADASGDRVVAFDMDGNFVAAYGGTGLLHNPADVAVNTAEGVLYVVDSYLHQMVIFALETGDLIGRVGRDEGNLGEKLEKIENMWSGGSHGALSEEDQRDIERRAEAAAANADGAGLGTEGAEPRDLVENRGSGPGEFRYPAFVEVDRSGRVYVTDQMNFRVQIFNADGTFAGELGSMGDGPGTFSRPKGVAVDSEGHIYVADGAFGNIQIFDAEGQLLLVFGQQGMGEADLWLPLGVFIDSNDRILVADRYHNRVQIYQYLPEAPRPSDVAEVRSPESSDQ
jgi:DNA-binding beta-propeller fold protein YncE